MFITMLADRSPAPDDLYQQFIGKLKLYWRIPLEIAVFVSAWILAYQCVVLERELLIRFESFSTRTPVDTIIARQTASSGMYAFGEGLEAIFVVTLLYLLWPVFFNLVGRYSNDERIHTLRLTVLQRLTTLAPMRLFRRRLLAQPYPI